jgi:L-methionine (R)-S-oxide reductase
MIERKTLFDALIKKIDELLKTESKKDKKLKAICRLLKENVSHYNWVGFYLVNEEKKDELILGPYEGEPTEHVRIPFGKGICGQAAKTETTFLVQDVSKETNYLSCSSRVKSEIVVPIFKNRQIAGELDIDSHVLSPFTKEDITFLNAVARNVSELF